MSRFTEHRLLLLMIAIFALSPSCNGLSSTNRTPSRAARSTDNVVLIPSEQQMIRLEEARLDCLRRMIEDPYPQSSGVLHCNRTWDNVMCWPDAPAGQTKFQPCPRYINMFRTDAFASRYCLPDGTWFFHRILNRTWTNYEDCRAVNLTSPTANQKLLKHVSYIKTISHAGYGLSFVTLAAAIFIMIRFKKLRCPRNILHSNLFASFMLRATMTFLKESLLVSGLGLPKDVVRSENNTVIFRDDVPHWECRLLMVIFNYAISTNYMWIFVEGFYLHTLIFMEIFLENNRITWYIVFGWAASLTFVVPWVIVRKLLENVYCWNTHPTPAYFWIVKTPVSISILVNFGFFVNVVRVLFTKLNAMNTLETQRHKHRKLAKSTLVLIPLFGVPYVMFMGLPDNMNETLELVKLYFEMTFNSFNGFVVAMLFCFLNGEVQNEFHKLWQHRRMHKSEFHSRRQSRTLLTTLTATHSSRTVHSSPQSVNPIRQSNPLKVTDERATSIADSTLRSSQAKGEMGQRREAVLFPMSDAKTSPVADADNEQRQPFLHSSVDVLY